MGEGACPFTQDVPLDEDPATKNRSIHCFRRGGYLKPPPGQCGHLGCAHAQHPISNSNFQRCSDAATHEAVNFPGIAALCWLQVCNQNGRVACSCIASQIWTANVACYKKLPKENPTEQSFCSVREHGWLVVLAFAYVTTSNLRGCQARCKVAVTSAQPG